MDVGPLFIALMERRRWRRGLDQSAQRRGRLLLRCSCRRHWMTASAPAPAHYFGWHPDGAAADGQVLACGLYGERRCLMMSCSFRRSHRQVGRLHIRPRSSRLCHAVIKNKYKKINDDDVSIMRELDCLPVLQLYKWAGMERANR